MSQETELLLMSLAEECAEVAQRVCKALRFGLDDVQLGQAENNRERIMVEMSDLVAIFEMLVERGELPAVEYRRVELKKEKVLTWIEYSKAIKNQREGNS